MVKVTTEKIDVGTELWNGKPIFGSHPDLFLKD